MVSINAGNAFLRCLAVKIDIQLEGRCKKLRSNNKNNCDDRGHDKTKIIFVVLIHVI